MLATVVPGFGPSGKISSRTDFRRGQLDYAFVVEDGKARLRLIRTGNSIEDKAEVLSGLQAGDMVVLDPPDSLMDGNPVDAQQEGSKP